MAHYGPKEFCDETNVLNIFSSDFLHEYVIMLFSHPKNFSFFRLQTFVFSATLTLDPRAQRYNLGVLTGGYDVGS